MQKNEIILEKQTRNFSIFDVLSLQVVTRRLGKAHMMHVMARFYSVLLERSFTPRQSVYVLYAQIMLLAALFPFAMSLGWRALFICLFCQSVKKSGLCKWR